MQRSDVSYANWAPRACNAQGWQGTISVSISSSNRSGSGSALRRRRKIELAGCMCPQALLESKLVSNAMEKVLHMGNFTTTLPEAAGSILELQRLPSERQISRIVSRLMGKGIGGNTSDSVRSLHLDMTAFPK